MIKSLLDAEKYLSQFIDKASKTTGKNVTVNRMWPLLDLVNNPQDKLRVIHIAGTSGKTSTAYYCSSLLSQSVEKVGLTVSPHVSKISERLQINGSPVSDEEFCRLLNEFIRCIGDDFDASYFEFMIVFVLWSFVELGVDYAVIETGLGGLHDGTNVFRHPDKICVITDIGFDHQHILGSTISEIASQKAGIIQRSNIVFMFEQNEDVMNQISARISEMDATLHVVDSIVSNGALPNYQQRNWSLAYQVFRYICKRDGIDPVSKEKLRDTMIAVPGRMQCVQSGDSTYVLDGAHNVQKMTAFVDSFIAKFGSVKVPCILAMKEDKDFSECIPLLGAIVSKVYTCQFNALQDMPIKSINSEILAESCKANGIESTSFSTIQDAINELQKENEPVVVITGSFYLLNGALQILQSS